MGLNGSIGLVAVGEHTEVVCHPDSNEVGNAVSLDPLSIPTEVVEIQHVHVFNHPFHALSIVIVPGAVASSFLGPDINHFSCEVARVREDGSSCKSNTHHSCLDILVAEVIICPQEEEFVLHETVERAESYPEQPLVADEREAIFK